MTIIYTFTLCNSYRCKLNNIELAESVFRYFTKKEFSQNVIYLSLTMNIDSEIKYTLSTMVDW